MIRAILAIVVACFSAPAFATTYYAAPGGGAAETCVDGATHVCTVARCISVAGNTDTCSLAAGTYPGSELGGSGYVIETGEFVNLTCAGAAGTCIFQPAGSNISGIRLNTPVAGGTITVTGIKIDGSLATPLDQCFYLNDSTLLYTVTLTDTTCAEADIYDVRVLANEITLTMTRNNFTASTAVSPRSYVGMVGTWAEGGVSIDTGTITLAKYDDTATPIVNLAATDAGETASVKNLTITVANDSATTTGYIDGILVTNIPNAVIDANTITVTGANVGSTGSGCSSCRQVRAIRCYSTGAFTSDNCALTNNTITAEAANGQMLAVGYDQTSAGNGQSTNGTISGNTVTCTASGTSTHGVGFFWSSGGKAYGNSIKNCGIGLLSKDQPTNGADFYANVVWGAWEEYAYAKGTTAPGFFNNALIVTNASGTPLLVGLDGGSNSTNVEFKNNLIWAPGGITPTNLVKTASSQTIAAGGATANDWYGFSAYQWTYLGSAYTTLATWNALSAVGTDTSADPGLLKSSPTEVSHLMPKAGSPLLRAGVCYLTGNCAYPDFRGHRSRVPPDVGVYQRSPSD